MQWVTIILLFCFLLLSGLRTIGMNQQSNGQAMWHEIYIFFNNRHYVTSTAGGGHISFYAKKHRKLFMLVRRDVGINFQKLCFCVTLQWEIWVMLLVLRKVILFTILPIPITHSSWLYFFLWLHSLNLNQSNFTDNQ